jgi:hypothetical protein
MPKKKELNWLFREHLELFIKSDEICKNQQGSSHKESKELEGDPDEDVGREGGGSAGSDYAIDEAESSVRYVLSLGHLSLIYI